MSKAQDAKFKAIFEAALAAGAVAGAAVVPTPMVVTQRANPLDDASPPVKSWFVADGVCGFGWVNFPGNTAFGRWARKNGLARKDWPSGLAISSKLMTQSLTRNAAWAEGFAKVLNENGIAASARSRID